MHKPVHSASILATAQLPALAVSQHADEHRSERPVLLAVDQDLAERPHRRIPPLGLDHAHSLEVGEHEDMKQLGAVRVNNRSS